MEAGRESQGEQGMPSHHNMIYLFMADLEQDSMSLWPWTCMEREQQEGRCPTLICINLKFKSYSLRDDYIYSILLGISWFWYSCSVHRHHLTCAFPTKSILWGGVVFECLYSHGHILCMHVHMYMPVFICLILGSQRDLVYLLHASSPAPRHTHTKCFFSNRNLNLFQPQWLFRKEPMYTYNKLITFHADCD